MQWPLQGQSTCTKIDREPLCVLLHNEHFWPLTKTSRGSKNSLRVNKTACMQQLCALGTRGGMFLHKSAQCDIDHHCTTNRLHVSMTYIMEPSWPSVNTSTLRLEEPGTRTAIDSPVQRGPGRNRQCSHTSTMV